jgi:hypothetical protein
MFGNLTSKGLKGIKLKLPSVKAPGAATKSFAPKYSNTVKSTTSIIR